MAGTPVEHSIASNLKGESSEIKKIRADGLYYRKDLIFIFNRMPLREEHKTGFIALITDELNLLVEFTNPAKDGLRASNSMDP
jgi:hypothetical protein